MSSNVGLTTPRGSGTSGYVQRNFANLRHRDAVAPYPRDFDKLQKHKQRQPNKEILEHDRKREVELKCLELRDKLEDDEVDEDEIENQVEALRKKLLSQMDNNARRGGRGLKTHQVHELAEAKMAENDRFGKALGIKADYEEGSHWRRQEADKVTKQQETAARAIAATTATTSSQPTSARKARSRSRSVSRERRRRDRDDSPTSMSSGSGSD